MIQLTYRFEGDFLIVTHHPGETSLTDYKRECEEHEQNFSSDAMFSCIFESLFTNGFSLLWDKIALYNGPIIVAHCEQEGFFVFPEIEAESPQDTLLRNGTVRFRKTELECDFCMKHGSGSCYSLGGDGCFDSVMYKFFG